MIVMPSTHSSPIVHEWVRRGFPIGWLIGHSSMTKTKLVDWIPFAVDNDAYPAWRQQKPWDEQAYYRFLEFLYVRYKKPLWVVVPDVVANRAATLESWKRHAPRVREFGWPLAFAAQDGMTPDDVPSDAQVVFIGGTDRWKWRNAELFCREFPRVHVGRVNTLDRLWICRDYGAESVDGTGWFRDGQAAWRFRKMETFFMNQRPIELPFEQPDHREAI